MHTATSSCRCPASRFVLALLVLLPAIVVVGFQLAARPDPETWLASHAEGFARPDAFDGVTRISPLFATCLGCTCVVAVYFVLSGRLQFLLPLAAGPLLASLVYLADYGLADPSWFTLLVLLTIGMLVSSPVAGIWAILKSVRLTKALTPDGDI